MSHNKLLR